MITRYLSFSLSCALALALTGCGGGDESAAAENEAAADSTQADASSAEAAKPKEEAPKPAVDFRKYPVSEIPLGSFPYFALPEGYFTNDRVSSTSDLGRYPFWAGEQFVDVQGRIYQANIRAIEGKTFSDIELMQNIDHVVKEAGGQLVAEGVIPRGAFAETFDRAMLDEFKNGMCWASEPIRTYLLRRADRDIWVQACTYGGKGGAWIIAETAAAKLTAKLIDADALKQEIDAAGHVAIEIEFASGAAEVLPTSSAQLDQVVALLQRNPSLKLAVEGHTDNVGDALHNLQLSQSRANAVMDMLVARGVTAARLKAQGFGETRPTAPNNNANGRARNRRVELVRI